MSNTLPITIQMGALPPTVKWTPQQLADAIAARMSLVTAQSFALFVTGSTAPTSDVGPWFKNGNEWYAWDSGSGAYVPATISQETLGYWVGVDAPDHNIFNFWISTTSGGSPLALNIYYNGAWTDVYASVYAGLMTVVAFNAAIANYSTTAQMNAAISAALTAYYTSAQTDAAIVAALLSYSTTAQVNAAIAAALTSYSTTVAMNAAIAAALTAYSTTVAMNAAINGALAAYSTTVAMNAAISAAVGSVNKYEFRAYKSAALQNYTAGTGAAQVTFDAENYDINAAFASNQFTAPVAGRYSFKAAFFIAISTGAPTGVERTIILRINGAAASWTKDQNTDDTDGMTIMISDTFNLGLGDTVDVAVDVVSTGASTWDIYNTSQDTNFSGYLIKS